MAEPTSDVDTMVRRWRIPIIVQMFGRGEADASDSRGGKRQGLLPLPGSVHPTGDLS